MLLLGFFVISLKSKSCNGWYLYVLFSAQTLFIYLDFVVCGYGKMMLFFGLNAFYFSFLIIAVVDEYSEVVFSILSVLSVFSLN